MKYIFPTAMMCRPALFKRTPINQWFDNYYVENTSQREDL
jgi:hypothetical protein